MKFPTLYCTICHQPFEDKGTHPVTCGKLDCVMQALRQGIIADVERLKNEKRLRQIRKHE